MDSLKQLYVQTLKDSYSAETQIIKALPKVIEAVSDDDLRKGLSEHLEQTREHAQIVSELARENGSEPGGEHCAGMEGLLKEGEKLIRDHKEGPVRDAALISACQKVEHYEISAYGTLRVYAKQLGKDQDAEKLSKILDQESAADSTLTKVAESHVNRQAVGAGN